MLRVDEYAQSLDSKTTRKGKDYFDLLRASGALSPITNKDYHSL
jgi:hypothetical protein